MNRWEADCPDCEDYLVFISAFSGFMAKNIDVVLEAASDILKRLHHKSFVCVHTPSVTRDGGAAPVLAA